MEQKENRIDWYDGFEMGDWGVCCAGKWFDLYKNSIGRLVADEDEDLEKIIFDVEKKTVSVKVKNPTYSNEGPLRTVDLSNAPEFFEELHKDIEMILTEMGSFESVTPNADRTVFEISGGWSASCSGKTFKIHNNGIKLIAEGDEDLEKIIFDTEKKTVSVKVKNPKLPEEAPRTVDLSEAPEFFEKLRRDIDLILTSKGTFMSVTPNADRTVFEILNKEGRIDWCDGFVMGEWRVGCWYKEFHVYKDHDDKLIAEEDEDLKKIIFDTEKKTVSVKVKNPRLSEDAPRIVDLSEAPEFFEELRKDIEVILMERGEFGSVTPNADRTVFEISDKAVRIDSYSGFKMGIWRVDCCGKTFSIGTHDIGAELAARGDEHLEKIFFDVEKKTVSVKVKNPKLTEPPKRILDLSEAPEFFEELRKNIEMILTEKGTFKSVTPNADRTVFEIS